jgi:hypothetical protein
MQSKYVMNQSFVDRFFLILFDTNILQINCFFFLFFDFKSCKCFMNFLLNFRFVRLHFTRISFAFSIFISFFQIQAHFTHIFHKFFAFFSFFSNTFHTYISLYTTNVVVRKIRNHVNRFDVHWLFRNRTFCIIDDVRSSLNEFDDFDDRKSVKRKLFQKLHRLNQWKIVRSTLFI